MSRKGENIYKRKDGRWEGRYIKRKISGRVQYGYLYGKSYSEVKKKLEIEKALCQQGRRTENVSAQAPAFKTLAESWFAEVRPTLKESSYVKYRNMISKHILPHLGEVSADAIDYAYLSAYASKLLSGDNQGIGLSGKTVSDILAVVKTMLKYAGRCKYSVDLSATKVSVKQKTSTVRTLSMDDFKCLITYLMDNPSLLNRGILISAVTGIRVGELCALTWGDFSFERKILHIHKTMQRLQLPDGGRKTSVQITAPKSTCSVRDIPIPEMLIPYLDADACANAYILSGSISCYVEPRSMQNHFRRVLRQCGIENVNFHVLRHTFATICIEHGFDIKSLSEILGHANVNITLNRYVHPSMTIKQQNMARISDLFTVK